MLIVCAGRSRSGSTLLYNLIRLTLIKLFGKDNVYGRGGRHYKKNHERNYNIVKLHDSTDSYFERTADYVFSSQRNEQDQRKSIISFRKLIKNQTISAKGLNDFIKFDYSRYKKWSGHKNFVKTFEYNDLVDNKDEVIKEICIKVINLNIIDDLVSIIIDEVDKLKMPSKEGKIDQETCLTWHHITGGIK